MTTVSMTTMKMMVLAGLAALGLAACNGEGGDVGEETDGVVVTPPATD